MLLLPIFPKENIPCKNQYIILCLNYGSKIFPRVIYTNSNLPEKRMKMILSEKEVAELPDESSKVYKQSMIVR